MPEPRTAPYGSWESSVRPEHLASTPVPLAVDAAPAGLYWLEGRPEEEGRTALVRCPRGGVPEDVVPRAFNVRSRVHEYGGGAYWRDGETVWFSHFGDGRVYRLDGSGSEPRPVTPEPSEPNALRFADGRLTADGMVVCVRESHEGPAVVNELVIFPADGSEQPRPLVHGNDFYAAPRPSPDGRRLAWLTWNDPQLPFTGTELWVGELAGGKVRDERLVIGGASESVFQPSWSPEGTLHFVSDRTGWWNIYRERDGGLENLTPLEAEFGHPAWNFDLSCYGFLDDGRIACRFIRRGIAYLGLLDPATGTLDEVELPYTAILPSVRTAGTRVAFVGEGPRDAPAVVELDTATGERNVYVQMPSHVDPESASPPLPIEFPAEDGATAFGFLYRPHNARFRAPDDELPPLIVGVHGGPTAQAVPALSPEIQFWTSRGFAYLDVNYGGSTGYGRRYMERLNGRWGVVDVEDSVAAARWLVEQGEADPNRVAIEGASAGGYTVLCALAFRDEFSAGVNHFGVVDLETFVRDTHKFEARYLDLLVGPYPEREELYRERSPINAAECIAAPLLTFQGLDDRVVPPSQSEELVDALERRGVAYAYIAFEGEGHGFRRSDSRLRVPTATLYFLSRIFRFEPADELDPIEIRNLD